MKKLWLICALLASLVSVQGGIAVPARRTTVTIVGDAFYMNGKPTYPGRTWRGMKIEGLLMNSRMVQGIFDDLNPETRSLWAYPDTGQWDPERNTREFVAAMADWRRHGLLAFTINLQGGSPQGYSRAQPWHNSAIAPDGSLRSDYMRRLERILNKADSLGMAVILGIFYFGQDQRLKDEAAVIRALDNAVEWVLDRGYRNVLIEVNNECNVSYDHAILRPERVHELIERVKAHRKDGRRLLVGTSYGGGTVPKENVVRASDFLLMHGNGVGDPSRISRMVREARSVPGYRPMPILFNEDDHFDFDRPMNNMVAAVSEYASWGYFDPGKSNYDDGYQCPPVKWTINTPRKRAFFELLAEMTGAVSKPQASERRVAARKLEPVTPGTTWNVVSPEQVGLRKDKLDSLAALVQGRGCVVRHGYLAYSWGDIARSEDVASAVKPVISILMLLAVHEGRLRSPDQAVADVLPELRSLNHGKDAGMTWRHLASQTSGYGLAEPPGRAWAYNDYALALYYDTLMDRVYRQDGTDVLRKALAVPLQFEDSFTFDAFGRPDRRGRLRISVRDFARFGLLCLREGRWGSKQILPRGLVRQSLNSIVPADLPRSSGKEAEMLPGQRTLGGGKNQTPTGPGYYSFNWWVNAVGPGGKRLYVDGPQDLYLAAGHGGMRMLIIIPSLDLVVSWNDSPIDDHDASPGNPNARCNRAVKLLVEAAQ